MEGNDINFWVIPQGKDWTWPESAFGCGSLCLTCLGKHRVTTIHGRQRAIFGTPKSQAGWLVFLSLIFLSVIKKMKHRFAGEGKVAVPYHHLLTQWTRVVVTCLSWDHATAPQSPPVCAACSGLLAWGSYTAIQRDGFLQARWKQKQKYVGFPGTQPSA